MSVFWLCLAQAAEVLPAAEPNLGTLFYSAAERRGIHQARLHTTGVAASAAHVVHVNGIVKREGGKSTAWMNGQAVIENQPSAAALGAIQVTKISQVGVVMNGKPVKVGETFDLTTQERSDIVLRGAVVPHAAQ